MEIRYETLIRQLQQQFEQSGVRFALIGGHALAAYGVPRYTSDIDFLVDQATLGQLDQALAAAGYKMLERTENVSMYQHTDVPALYIDVLHAFRPTAMAMLSDSFVKGEVRILQPEDFIGLKVQAIANDKKRKYKDMADIDAILSTHPDLDHRKVKQYFAMFNLGDLYAEVVRE